MPTFSDIEHEIDNVLSSISPDMSEEEQAAFNAYLKELAEQEVEKADNFGFKIKALYERSDSLKDLSAEISKKAKAVENAAHRLRAYYLDTMLEKGLERVKGDVFTLSRRSAKSVEVYDQNQLPESLIRTKTTVEPDKAEIKALLDKGVEVPGARLVSGFYLQIR